MSALSRPAFTLITSSTALACALLLSAGCGSSGGGGGGGGTTSNMNNGGSGNQNDGGMSGSGGASSGNAGNAGTAGNAGSGGTGPIPGMGINGNPDDGEIGARCTEATDCREELTCIPSTGDVGGFGGPPLGWCTLPCAMANEGNDCLALSEVATCFPFDDAGTPDDFTDDTGFCTEVCFIGTPLDAATENKCHQRAELACLPIDNVFGVCLPSCASDADCDGRFCDLAAGTCVDAAPAGDPIGTSCAVDGDTCAGFCFGLDATSTTGFCSGVCTLGSLGCGADPASADPLAAFCLAGGSEPVGEGDLGLCFQGCDCNDECLSTDHVCLPLGNPNLEAFYGRAGLCLPPLEPVAVADAGAADAGADPLVTGIICP